MKLQELFKSFIGKDEIISVYCNPDDNYATIVGFAAQIDDDYLICNEVSRTGEYDGYVLRKAEQIFRIDHGSYYENSLTKAFAHEKSKHKNIPNDKSVFINFINFAKETGLVVSVGIREHSGSYSVTGYIDSIDEENENLTIHTITKEKEGGFDGFTVVNFADCFRMCCDAYDERYFQLLNKIANGDNKYEIF